MRACACVCMRVYMHLYVGTHVCICNIDFASLVSCYLNYFSYCYCHFLLEVSVWLQLLFKFSAVC